MFFKSKKIDVPISNETKQVDAVEFWQVQWYSRYGNFHGDIEQENEVFTNEQAAKDFAESIRNAFKLLRFTSGTKVKLFKK